MGPVPHTSRGAASPSFAACSPQPQSDFWRPGRLCLATSVRAMEDAGKSVPDDVPQTPLESFKMTTGWFQGGNGELAHTHVASHRSSSACPVQPCGFRHTSLLCSLCAVEVILPVWGSAWMAERGSHERRHSRTPRCVWTCHPCLCSPLRGQGRSAPCHLRVPFPVTQSREYLSSSTHRDFCSMALLRPRELIRAHVPGDFTSRSSLVSFTLPTIALF